MSDKLGEAPGNARRDAPEGFAMRSVPEDDVEGHNLRRDEGEGAGQRRDVGGGEGAVGRRAIPDEGDDVEGHSLYRGGEGSTLRDGEGARLRGEDELAGRIGPGEGNTARA